MADLRYPVMADISYDNAGRQPDRSGEFARPRVVARSHNGEKQKAAVQCAVEFEVVPRLLHAHRQLKDAPTFERTPPVFDGIKALAEYALGRSQDAAALHIEGLLEQGASLEELYLKLLAPTATYLKQLWIDDERDFAEVTLALWRLQQLLREFSSAFRRDAHKPTGQRVLLTLASGETHELPYLMFALVLSGEFFRREGWSTWIEPDSTRSEISALVRTEWFDVVEFLVNGDKKLELLAAQIKVIRSESINQSVCIGVAGNTVHQHPEFVKFLGADVLAESPKGGGSAYAISNR
jgi:hypothetical protein